MEDIEPVEEALQDERNEWLQEIAEYNLRCVEDNTDGTDGEE